MKQAFTLIELLVAVLIIGILLAAALPQYQKAVDLARVKATFPAIRAIVDAEKAYRLANGTYTKNFQELSVDFPVKKYENGKITLADGVVYVIDNQGTYWHVFAYPFTSTGVAVYWAIETDWWICYHFNNNRWKKVCQALGCSNAGTTSCRFYLR